ncbi:MAG: GGGtGRT protein [Clostridia bacterium]|nr:GGGtGRT protein [Clostridia bacterium]
MNELFTGYSKRSKSIKALLDKYNIPSIEVAAKAADSLLDVDEFVHNVQPIAFDNTVWAFKVGTALALKTKTNNPQKIAILLGEALQAFCVPGSVADKRKVGLGHGNLAATLLDEKTKCFCFIAGHESFAASEGAIALATSVNKVRKTPLRVVINGLGKDAAYIISRIGGFTYVETDFDYSKEKLIIKKERAFSKTERKNVRVYGALSVNEGVAICIQEHVDISITGNSTNPTRFQHPVAGIYKKYCVNNHLPYFSIASGGGTGRTLHPDNLGAGPASYGLTDTMGRMHCDAQFAGSSSVPAHVYLMGFVGMGNNPLMGCCVSMAVRLSELIK